MADRRERMLADAVWDGDRAKVERLLAEGVSPQSRNDVSSALRGAVCTRRPDLVELLLRHGADVEDRSGGSARDEEDGSLLHRAAFEAPRPEALAVVRLLVEHGASLDARDNEGATPFLVAVREASRHSPAVQAQAQVALDMIGMLGELLGSKVSMPAGAVPDVDPADRFAMIDTLLSLGARIDDRDAAGSTAAMIAFQEQDEELLAGLRERGASEAGVDTARLVAAASEGREADVAALLAGGADPNRRFTRSGTAFSEAAQEGHLAVVERLLQAGADPNLSESGRPEGDFNPLFRAVYSGHLEVVRRLLAAGADPLRKGPGGARVLDYAKLGEQEGHKKDAPWDEILALLRDALREGPARLGLAPLGIEPVLRGVIAELRGALPVLAGLAWSRAQVGGFEILESSLLPGNTTPDWDRLREIARRHGFAPFFAAWSLEDLEPDVQEIERDLAAIDAGAGRAWMAEEVAAWRKAARDEAEELADSGEEEDDESLPRMLQVFETGPITRGSRGVALRLERHRLVLLGGGAPEAAAVIYGFGQPDLQPVPLASVLRSWRETVGAELAAFTRDTLALVLPRPIENDAEVRRCALEIYVVDSDLDGARHILAMAASRQWSFWWD